MNEEQARELIFSLGWYDCSNYHHTRVLELLKRSFPERDFSQALAQFEECRAKPAGEGCPR